MIRDWAELKAFAQSLDLPRVTLEHPWGNEALKAHGRMWCWWSPFEDAAVFRAGQDEREMLMEAEPATFHITPHYKDYPSVLARIGTLHPGSLYGLLERRWRKIAPKAAVKAFQPAKIS